MSKWTSNKEWVGSHTFDPQSLLKYYKTVLEKVSFDPQLMTKEYKKALKDLGKEEAVELIQWMQLQGLAAKLEPVTNQNSTYKWPQNQVCHENADNMMDSRGYIKHSHWSDSSKHQSGEV